MLRSGRSGTALIAAIVIVIVLDCIVIGTLHIALLEQNLARNATAALHLRLAAETAAREPLRAWPDAADTMAPGVRMVVRSDGSDGVLRVSTIERISPSLWLARGDARLAAPRHGRAAAALLLHAPWLPASFRNDDAAAIATGGFVRIPSGGVLERATDCSISALIPVRAVDDERIEIDSRSPEVRVIPEDATSLEVRVPATAPPADSTIQVHDGDVTLRSDVTGVVIVSGDLRIAAPANISGIVIVTGSIVIEAGAAVRGVLHAGADVTIAGGLLFDPCLRQTVLDESGLARARPRALRARVPAF